MKIYNRENLENKDSFIIKKWDLRFLSLAKHISNWSKDPSTRVGAVIVDEKRRIIGIGYNGFPRKIPDEPEDYENREIKYKKIIHAEANAILNAPFLQFAKYTCLYVYPLFVCNECAKLVIQSDIKRVVTVNIENNRFRESFEISKKMLNSAGIDCMIYDAKLLND